MGILFRSPLQTAPVDLYRQPRLPARPAGAHNRRSPRSATGARPPHCREEQGLDRSYFSNRERPARRGAKGGLAAETNRSNRSSSPIRASAPCSKAGQRSSRASAREPDARGRRRIGRRCHGALWTRRHREDARAVEYAGRCADDYTALLFVIGETPDDLPRNLAALTGRLDLRARNTRRRRSVCGPCWTGWQTIAAGC